MNRKRVNKRTRKRTNKSDRPHLMRLFYWVFWHAIKKYCCYSESNIIVIMNVVKNLIKILCFAQDDSFIKKMP